AESHGKVDVPLRDVLFEPFDDERDADQQEEAQRQDLHRRVTVHERTNRPRRDHHHADRDDHGGDHHRDLVHHPNCGDHRVQGEHDVQQQDLDDDVAEGGMTAYLRSVLTLQLVMDLDGALRNEEQTTHDEDQVPAGELHTQEGNE